MKEYSIAIDFSSIMINVEAENEDEAVGMVQQQYQQDPSKFLKETEVVSIGDYVEVIDE
ncbi:MAG: hypothetical protein ABGY11_02595 [Candidatus Thioglobus sp.]|jgi:hypothetical protein